MTRRRNEHTPKTHPAYFSVVGHRAWLLVVVSRWVAVVARHRQKGGCSCVFALFFFVLKRPTRVSKYSRLEFAARSVCLQHAHPGAVRDGTMDGTSTSTQKAEAENPETGKVALGKVLVLAPWLAPVRAARTLKRGYPCCPWAW